MFKDIFYFIYVYGTIPYQHFVFVYSFCYFINIEQFLRVLYELTFFYMLLDMKLILDLT